MENTQKNLIYCPIFRNELRAVLGHARDLTLHELGYDIHNHPATMLEQLKAGILEIADLFVVNKGDKPDADKTVRELEVMLDMSAPREDGWRPQILKVSAIKGEGIKELMDALEEHRKFLETSGRFESYRKDRVAHAFETLLRDKLFYMVMNKLKANGTYEKLLEDMFSKRKDPYSVIEGLRCQCSLDIDNN